MKQNNFLFKHYAFNFSRVLRVVALGAAIILAGLTPGHAWDSMISCADAFTNAGLTYLTNSPNGYYYICTYNTSMKYYTVMTTGCGCCPTGTSDCISSSGCASLPGGVTCTGCTCTTQVFDASCNKITVNSCKEGCCGTGYPACGQVCGSCQKCSGGSCVNKSCGTNCALNAGNCTCTTSCPPSGSDSVGTFKYNASGSCAAPV